MMPEPQPAQARRVYSMDELQREYVEFLGQAKSLSLDLAEWLPSFRGAVRPLVPGELAFIMADTGCGKSMALQCIAHATSEPILFCEMELPRVMMFERFAALSHKTGCAEIELRSAEGHYWSTSDLAHVWVCDDTRMTAADIGATIEASAKRIGCKPSVVMVDYIGLMAAGGKSRYERMSYAAEELKVLAKQANVVVIAATQRSRPSDDGQAEVNLHDGKDSGSIENSCGLMLGMWKTAFDKLTVRVLKNTKGRANFDIECDFDGARMSITETKKWNETPEEFQ